MIPFKTWLPQIIGYCQLVVDAEGLERAWVDGDFSLTSVTDFDELYEQIFDDLDSDNIEKELTTYLSNDVTARKKISDFLSALRVVNIYREDKLMLSNSSDLLNSYEWLHVVEVAKRLLAHNIVLNRVSP
jgi:hypothetical protein